MLRRTSGLAVALALVAATVAMIAPASAGTDAPNRSGPCLGYRWMANDVAQHAPWSVVKTVRKTRTADMIDCVAQTYGVPRYAFADVAWRESGMWHRALNPTSHASGLFQHLRHLWPTRARNMLNPAWFGDRVPGPFNARANAIVSAKMWRAQGGPCPAWC